MHIEHIKVVEFLRKLKLVESMSDDYQAINSEFYDFDNVMEQISCTEIIPYNFNLEYKKIYSIELSNLFVLFDTKPSEFLGSVVLLDKNNKFVFNQNESTLTTKIFKGPTENSTFQIGRNI